MRNLMPLAMLVAVLVTIDAIWVPVVLGTASLAPDLYSAAITPIARDIDGAELVLKLVTFVVFGTWIYLAGRNLVLAGHDDTEFTPGARVWWFFVPVASLFKPFQGVRELWNLSHGEDDATANHGLLTIWWGLWLANAVGGQIVSIMARGGATPSATLYWANAAADLSLAGAAIPLVLSITRAQLRQDGADLGEVFA